MKKSEQNRDYSKNILLKGMAESRGFKFSFDQETYILETAESVINDKNTIVKNLLGQTATIKDIETTESILNYIKKLPNYEQLIAEARDTLIEEGVKVPEPQYIETFQPGSLGWMRQIIDICK